MFVGMGALWLVMAAAVLAMGVWLGGLPWYGWALAVALVVGSVFWVLGGYEHREHQRLRAELARLQRRPF